MDSGLTLKYIICSVKKGKSPTTQSIIYVTWHQKVVHTFADNKWSFVRLEGERIKFKKDFRFKSTETRRLAPSHSSWTLANSNDCNEENQPNSMILPPLCLIGETWRNMVRYQSGVMAPFSVVLMRRLRAVVSRPSPILLLVFVTIYTSKTRQA